MAPDADPIGPLRAAATDALDLGPPSGDPPPPIDHDAARRLVEAVRRGWSIDPDDARAQIAVINASPGAVGPSVRRAIDALGDARATLRVLDSDPSRWSIEDAHEGAIGGGVRAAITDRTGRVFVLGTDADNVYDMSRIHAVLDPAGNDEYRWPDTPGSRRSSADRVVIDHDGDDRYLGETPFSGPGAGVFAGSLIDDHAGDDVYESPHAGSIGFGLFGVGVIIDRAGHDTYTNTGPASGWSLGAGFYGVGLLIDHAGNDVYHAEKLAQGVGGPRGLGAILDARGADTYRANGPNFPSAYGTPGVFLGMSQGFGIGVRGYAAGGVGLIDDARGDDRYIAGEFSQGGGYFFGLGMIRDRAGDDLYAGNRYGQAFAAHQAAGVLIDDAGDDLYRSMTAASQSGAWDESVTMLIDRSGNDAYGCDVPRARGRVHAGPECLPRPCGRRPLQRGQPRDARDIGRRHLPLRHHGRLFLLGLPRPGLGARRLSACVRARRPRGRHRSPERRRPGARHAPRRVHRRVTITPAPEPRSPGTPRTRCAGTPHARRTRA